MIILIMNWCISLSIYTHVYTYKHISLAPIKGLDFRGFESSRLSILKGGNSHVRRI